MELQYYLVGLRSDVEIEIRKDGKEIYRGTCEDAVLCKEVLDNHHCEVIDVRYVLSIYVLCI